MRNIFFTIIFALLLPQIGFAQLTPAIDQQISVKNYLTNGGFESGVAGWKAYKDAAGVTPVDATGGSPALTITASATTPITGKSSGVITKSASNLQGEGVSVAFVTDKDARGKVINITGSYEIVSGTYSGGTSSTDSDVELAIYDVDTSTYIQPTGYKLDGGVTGVTYGFSATFQPLNLTSTNYRLALHVATTSASAYTLKIDGVKIGLYNKSQGPPVTDWVSFTPTGSWISNTTYTGYWRRVGDSMEVQSKLALAGAPTSAALTINIPSGFTIDTAKLASSTQNLAKVGIGGGKSAGTGIQVIVAYNTTTSVDVRYQSAVTATSTAVTQAAPATFASGDEINVTYHVPIVGWSSTVTMSDSTDTRVVALYAKTSTNTVPAVAGNTTWTTTVHDTHGGMQSSTAYTVMVPGYYSINTNITATPTATTGGTFFLDIKVNGTTVLPSTNGMGIVTSGQQYTNTASVVVFLKAGDSVTIPISQNTGSTVNINSGQLNIMRIAGPSQIASSELVAARYNSGAGATVTNNTTTLIDFGSKDFDTHGAVTTGASWKFTAPISGKYRVSSYVLWSSASFTSGNHTSLQLFKNGSGVQFFGKIYIEATATVSPAVWGTTIANLVAGDYIDVRIDQDSGGSRSLTSSATACWIEIERIGN